MNNHKSKLLVIMARIVGMVAGVLLLCLVPLAIWKAVKHDRYSQSIPPKESFCARWEVDNERSTWHDLRRLVQSEDARAQHGFLDIKPDGRFSIENFVDFSFGIRSHEPLLFYQHMSGRWRSDIDMQHHSYLWLDYDMLDGKTVTGKHGTLYFRRDGNEYLLFSCLWDPDGNEELVFRKSIDEK